MADAIEKKIASKKATAADYGKYFQEKNSELEIEYTHLIDGTMTKSNRGYRKVGYAKLRDFFDGDQWDYVPESGQKMRTYNFCRGVILNYTAFMTSEPIDIAIAPKNISDDIEVARAEAKEKVLLDILDDNQFNVLFEQAIQNGSLLGDSIILGPFYNEVTDRITIQNIKRPENVRIIWTDDSFSEISGFIHHYYVTPEKAYEIWADQIEEKNITLNTVEMTNVRDLTSNVKTMRRMVEVMDCWTADVHYLQVGSKELDFTEHNWGFVPITHVPNILHPTDAYGTSDLEDILDAQVEFNEKNSDMSEIINEQAFSKIFGKNLKPQEVQSGVMQLIDMGDEAELMSDPRRTSTADLSNEISRRQSSLYQLSGLNENIFGGQGVRAVTGRALAVLMQTVNNRIKGRQVRWTLALQLLFKNIFKLVEEYIPNGKELVGGYYKTDIFFPGTLMRNITDEINKFNAKLQSQETTMKNLGIPSPREERKLMVKEMKDDIMMVEISRNPALQLQIHQMLQQQVAGKVAGNGPQIREDENMDEQPSAAGGAPQQSAVSAAGAVNQSNQRNGSSVALESEGA